MKPYLIGLFVLTLAGCATVGNSSLATRADDWPPLTMTHAHLITELGPPSGRTLSVVNGTTTETLTWDYARLDTTPWAFVPVVGLFVLASGESTTVDVRALSVTFTDGRMTSRIWAQAHTK